MFQSLSNNNICITGTEIESLVYAIDLIGHKSKTAKSNGIIIDTTHPEPTLMEHLEENIAVNPSFEETNGDTIINCFRGVHAGKSLVFGSVVYRLLVAFPFFLGIALSVL
jgi:hypothetical protein